MIKALSCIVCDRQLEGMSEPNHPLDGVAFFSRGNYGSTVFDPMDGSALEINVCDPCLRAAGLKGQVLRSAPEPTSRRTAAPWKDE